ncbi:MAG: FtsH protease activity modulator HflK [bacterium]|nr:FtsH protease activity modulator HflK [bacterium]
MDNNFQDWFEKIPTKNGGPPKSPSDPNRPEFNLPIRKIGLAALLIVAFFLFLAFRPWVQVEADELGVVLRLGKYNRTLTPGLSFRLPPPIEIVYTPKVTQIRRIEIGFRSSQTSRTPAEQIPEESHMLTGDENIVVAKLAVQYIIVDPLKYLFNSENVDGAVKDIAEAAFRQVVGDYPIDATLKDRRTEIAAQIKESIQAVSDLYEMGVQINQVQLHGTDVPAEVKPAFRSVVSARENMVRYVNEAEGYRNSEIPKAEGQVQQMLQEAEAYRAKRIAESQGEVERFAAVLREYENAPEVTRARLYYETMEKVLPGKPKVILGVESGNDLLKFLNVAPPGGPAPLPPAQPENGGQRP